MKTLSLILSLLYIIFPQFTFSQKTDSIRIGLFVGEFPTRANITVNSWGYEMNGKEIKNGEILQVNLAGDSLEVVGKNIGKSTLKKLELIGPIRTSRFNIKTNNNGVREYYGSLEIKVIRGVMRMVNSTPMQGYIAGVVDAETGPKSSSEFYKVQAIIARTFAIENLQKHQDFGFNLCDQVHCQVFKGTTVRSELIPQAVAKTQDLVLYENNGNLAYAPYHSNCGGQTETSENVWGGKKAYLCSVKDPYCLNESKSVWEKHISLEKWNKWLTRNHLEPMVGQLVDWEQPTRKNEVKLGGKTFETRKIRTEFGLNSSFFNIKVTFKDVIFRGKGYGHGVGICQQGASRMAALGYDYQSILKHYYQGLRVAKAK